MIRKTAFFLSLILMGMQTLAFAQPDQLQPVSIKDKGEMILNGEELTYQPWSSEQLKGKVRTVIHIAGRTSAKEINQAFIDALKAAKFDQNDYQTTTIVNLDDAIWGTTPFVISKATNSKKEFHWSSMVLDAQGAFLKAHQLAPKNSAIFILDKDGSVLFSKDGPLNQDEINQTISLISETIEKSRL